MPRALVRAAAWAGVCAISLFGSQAFAQQRGGQPFTVAAPYITTEPHQAVSAWVGPDFTQDSYYIFSGADIAVNGDLSRPGFVINLESGGSGSDGTLVDVLVRAGYQGLLSSNVGWEAKIGVHVEVDNEDTHEGFTAQAAAEVRDPKPFYWGMQGDYSTVFNSYYTRARVGYELEKLLIGPEGVFFGSDGTNDQRAGGFVTFPVRLTPKFKPDLTVSSGYQWVQSEEGQPAAGGIGRAAGTENSWYITASAGWSF
jgi:hypothetical protein